MTFVELKNNVPKASTLTIAEGMEVKHRAVLELLDKYKIRFEKMGTFTFETEKTKGRPLRIGWLNEQQTVFICSLMRNTERVLDFKQRLSEDFVRLKDFALQVKAQQKDPDWKQVRNSGKLTRKESTDIIQDFIEYAKSQGSKNADNYFRNFTSMENKALFIITQKFKNVRDVLDGQQLMVIGTCDQIVLKAIKAGMEEDMFYKDIFQEAKKEVLKFVDIIGKSYVPTQKQISKG